MRSFERQYYEYNGFWDWNVASRPGDARRVEEIFGMIPNDVSSILDVGCGNGIFCDHVGHHRPFARVVGLDRSRTALGYVKAEKILGDVTQIPHVDGAFDCVAALEVLEHLPIREFQIALREIARVARKYVIACVPDRQVWWNATRCPSCKAVFDPDLHMQRFDSRSFHDLFLAHGLTCIEIKPIFPYQVLAGIHDFVVRLDPRHPPKSYMDSPVCPACGHENPTFFSDRATRRFSRPETFRARLYAGLTGRLLGLWPRVYRYSWIAGVFMRDSKEYGDETP